MSEVNDCPDYSCFDDIIGLSETHCECYSDNAYDVSTSCLYLDQAEGMNLRVIESLEDCGTEEDLWQLMARSRTKAVKRFVTDVTARMNERYNPQRTFFKGYLGKNQFKQLRTLNNTYVGCRFRTAQVVGGYIKISHINTLFQATGTITLSVYNSLNELMYSVALDTEAGKMHSNALSTPITLPMWDGRCDDLDYVFLYTYDSANRPYDNKLSCCGRTYHFDCLHPYYKQKSNKLDGWASWFMAGAYGGDSLDFSDLPETTSDYMNGLQFQLETYCEAHKSFCFDTANIHDVQFMSVAFAIYHAAAQYLALDIITSDKINRYTMVNIENMEAVRRLHEDKYKELITYLVDNVDLRNTDCFMCKEKFAFRHGVL